MPAGGLISVSYNEYFPVPGVTIAGISWAPGARALTDEATLKAGSFTKNLPTNPNPYSAVAGGVTASYFDDYYNRLHMTPERIDFGPITSPQSAGVLVWNAFVEQSVNLTGVQVDSLSGLSVSPATPQSFAPLQSRLFTLMASADGAAILDLPLVWQFDVPAELQLRVTGSRSKEWPLEPNWDQSYKLTYSFKTEIITSRSGREQRIALRTAPRKELNYRSLAIGDRFNAAKDLLWQWQARTLTVPELTRFINSTAVMGSGQNVMAVDQTPPWLVEGLTVILRVDGVSEARTIASVGAGSVTFTSVSGTTWPVGVRLHPALSGYIATSTPLNRSTNAVATVSVNLKVTPLSEPWVAPGVATETFNGRELFLKRPNWAQEVSVNTQHSVDEIDFDRGAVARFTPIKFGTETRRALYLNRDASEAQSILDFFFRMRGRQGEFYMPTWEYDFVPVSAASPAGAALRVKGSRLADAYGQSTVHKAIFVLLNDGSLLFRKVLSVAHVTDLSGTDSVITVDQVWGVSFDASSIVMCGWMPVWRMASDDLTVEWLTNSVAQVQMSMQTLEDLPVETP